MFSIAICDDNREICSKLEKIILEFSKFCIEELEVEVYIESERIVQDLKQGHKYNLIFLDIEFEEQKLDGMKVAECVRWELDDYFTHIVFISSYERYYAKLFKYQVFEFLRKPFEELDVISIINKSIRMSYQTRPVLSIKSGIGVEQVLIRDIMYMKSIGNKRIELIGVNILLQFYDNLNSLEKRVAPHGFVQCHQSYIVNLNYVAELKLTKLILKTGTEIPVSRRQHRNIKALLRNMKMSESQIQ